MKYLYHATSMSNLGNILDQGITPSAEGYVFATEKPKEALLFMAVRGIKEVLMLKFKVYKNDENRVIETFDHSEAFFKCRCFGYIGTVETKNIADYKKYEL